MLYFIGDEVIFYGSSSEKALEVERKGFITKINNKTCKIMQYEIDEDGKKIFVKEKLFRKDLLKTNITDNSELFKTDRARAMKAYIYIQ